MQITRCVNVRASVQNEISDNSGHMIDSTKGEQMNRGDTTWLIYREKMHLERKPLSFPMFEIEKGPESHAGITTNNQILGSHEVWRMLTNFTSQPRCRWVA